MQRTSRRSCRCCPKGRWNDSTDRLRSLGCSQRKNLRNRKQRLRAVRNELHTDRRVGRDHKCKWASIASQQPTTTPALPSARRTVCATWSNRSNVPTRLGWMCLVLANTTVRSTSIPPRRSFLEQPPHERSAYVSLVLLRF